MEGTITRPSPRCLPHEIISLIASKIHSLYELSLFSLVSRAFHSETVSFLYTHIEFASAAQGPRPKWIKKISLWARTINYNSYLARRAESLCLHLPECDLPVLYRQTLTALRLCINLRELEIHHPPHLTLSSWLIPAISPLALTKFTTDLQASDSLARILESQPSIRTLRLETFDMQLWLEPDSLPILTHYTGFTRLVSAARVSGAVWENLVHAELHDAYRWELGLLDSMPRLRALDITVAAGAADLLARIVEKCPELESLTLRDSNGIMHDRRELADGRLAGVSATYTCTSRFCELRAESDRLIAGFRCLVWLIEASFVLNHRSCIPSSTTRTSTHRPSAACSLALLLPDFVQIHVAHRTQVVISTHRPVVRL